MIDSIIAACFLSRKEKAGLARRAQVGHIEKAVKRRAQTKANNVPGLEDMTGVHRLHYIATLLFEDNLHQF